jgi:DNA-directed RNA polymerase specialized sigma24 family protein
MQDFSLKETAEIVKKNVNAVKAIQNRAINNLREALHRDYVA